MPPPSAVGPDPLQVAPEGDTLLEERTDPVLDDGDEPRIAHIVRKADATRGYVTGEAVVALCGKKWVPSRNPDSLPVCPACKAKLNGLKAGRGGHN